MTGMTIANTGAFCQRPHQRFSALTAGKLSRAYEEFDFERRLTHIDAENQEISKSIWQVRASHTL